MTISKFRSLNVIDARMRDDGWVPYGGLTEGVPLRREKFVTDTGEAYENYIPAWAFAVLWHHPNDLDLSSSTRLKIVAWVLEQPRDFRDALNETALINYAAAKRMVIDAWREATP